MADIPERPEGAEVTFIAHNGAMTLDADALETALMELEWGVSYTAEESAQARATIGRTIVAYLTALTPTPRPE